MSLVQGKPLVDRMLNKMNSWTINFLSYPLWKRTIGLKCVVCHSDLLGQVFALPKKIFHVIESICRRFLWTGNVENSKKVLIAWD